MPYVRLDRSFLLIHAQDLEVQSVSTQKQQFSVKVGTVLEDSPIARDKWLSAFWLIANAKNGISSY